MNIRIRLLFTVICIMGLAGFASCHKDNSTPVTPPSPLQAYIAGDTSLSVFNSAILRANDASLYAGSDSATVLIPTNSAFASRGITAASINNMRPGAVDSMLKYLFISNSANLTKGSYRSYNSALGSPVYGYGGVTDSNYFNGARAARQPAISGSKATVYKLSSPLGTPASSASQLIGADTSLTFFAQAVKRSGIDLSASGTSFNTILAPTNNAYRAAGYPTIASIDAKDAAVLKSMLQYNVLPGQYFTNSFNGMANVATTSAGNNINISFNNGVAQFKGTGNTAATTISNANQLAGTNTVVQTVNGVLLQ